MLTEEEFMILAHKRSRDTSRTPIHWNKSKNGGFTYGDSTWIGMCDNYDKINVEDDIKDPDSVLNFFKKLIALRKSEYLLVTGDVKLVLKDVEGVFSFTRNDKEGKESLLIFCNFENKIIDLNLREVCEGIEHYKLDSLLSNYKNIKLKEGILSLKPFEGILFKVLK